jgi:hypothetical protein
MFDDHHPINIEGLEPTSGVIGRRSVWISLARRSRKQKKRR